MISVGSMRRVPRTTAGVSLAVGVFILTILVISRRNDSQIHVEPSPIPMNIQESSAARSARVAHTTTSHLEIVSNITSDGEWWPVDFGEDHPAANVNFVPHELKDDTWFIVAQHYKYPDDYQIFFTETVCEGTFDEDGTMRCNKTPLILPIPGTTTDKCVGKIGFFNMITGPRDARVFYGPEAPYIIYGSQSQDHCLGQWIHDFRRLVDWSPLPATDDSKPFFFPQDIRRPLPRGNVEKNYFAFWDDEGAMYAHFDLPPKRAFAKLHANGVADRDLAPHVAKQDAMCVAMHMPKLSLEGDEHNHQATNSLAIVMCKRSDLSCQKTKQNTFIFEIFQAKAYHNAHPTYEPYLMVFQQTAPFALHAFSKRPLWIHGRGEAGGEWMHNTSLPEDHSEMIYITSMSWRNKELKYLGYLDDELLIGFGVEDRQSGGIDVVAGHLMDDLAYC